MHKEGASKLGLLFTQAQLKDGKEVPLMLALVSVAPRWEPGGADLNLRDITIASYSMGEPGTILQSPETTVYLDSGSRLRILAQ